MFSRYKLSEITFARAKGALKRRIDEIPYALSWVLSPQAANNRRRLAQFSNLHQGQRCFIIGNGPSLAKMDLSLLKDEVTFGLNRIYLLFDKISFTPTYYVCVNELVLEQFASEIQLLRLPKFLNWNRRELFNTLNEDVYFVKLALGLGDSFGRSPLKLLSGGGTVTYVAMQIAYFMGFREVILIGVDHNFVDKGIPNITEVRRTEQDSNHFHPDYFPKGVRWQFPDLLRSEIAYSLARQIYRQDNRRILDATVDGKCPVFERVDFYSLFS